MGTKQIENAARVDGFSALPELFRIETNKESSLYDPRNEMPVDEGLIESVYTHGVMKQIVCVRDGEGIVVVDGNQRVRAALVANARLRSEKRDLIQVPFRIRRMVEENIPIEKCAINFHVESTPMMKARQAQRLEALGRSKKEIAIAMGFKSETMVTNALKLLDLDVKVQKAIEKKELSPSTAIKELAGVERSRQRDVFEQMSASGALKGEHASRASRAAKEGKPIPAKGKGKKMRRRETVQELLDRLEVKDVKKETTAIVIPLLRWVLGEKDSETELPDDAAETLEEMQLEKDTRTKHHDDPRQLKMAV